MAQPAVSAAMKKNPPVPPLVKAPTTEDKAVQEAAANAARSRQKGFNYRSTILSQMGASTGLKDTLGA